MVILFIIERPLKLDRLVREPTNGRVNYTETPFHVNKYRVSEGLLPSSGNARQFD